MIEAASEGDQRALDEFNDDLLSAIDRDQSVYSALTENMQAAPELIFCFGKAVGSEIGINIVQTTPLGWICNTWYSISKYYAYISYALKIHHLTLVQVQPNVDLIALIYEVLTVAYVWNLRWKWPNPFEKRRLRQIPAYNVSTARDCEKINYDEHEVDHDEVRKLPLSPPNGG